MWWEKVCEPLDCITGRPRSVAAFNLYVSCNCTSYLTTVSVFRLVIFFTVSGLNRPFEIIPKQVIGSGQDSDWDTPESVFPSFDVAVLCLFYSFFQTILVFLSTQYFSLILIPLLQFTFLLSVGLTLNDSLFLLTKN